LCNWVPYSVSSCNLLAIKMFLLLKGNDYSKHKRTNTSNHTQDRSANAHDVTAPVEASLLLLSALRRFGACRQLLGTYRFE
jgi:hypothetical protein